MLLFVALSIFYSCTADEDILLEAINQNNTKEPKSIESGFDDTTSGSETSVQTDASVDKEGPDTVPIAVATPSSGAAPLEVTFTVGDALAGKTFAKYEWKFKDGTKASASKAVHTFKEAGKHEVELTATDDEGQVVNDTVTVTVTEPINEVPKAVAIASRVSGEAPLQVDFTGSGSSDDKSIAQYSWDFANIASSDQADTSYTFDTPGVYDISLTVSDEEGLQDTSVVTITVNQKVEETIDIGNIACGNGSGKAGDLGEKVWCWNSITIPDYSSSKGVGFSDGELYVDSQCYEKQVTIEGDKIKFRIDPVGPTVGAWCSEDFNMRAEIRTAPWDIRHQKGTEEWFGWSYTFGDSYVIDQNNEWAFFQVHPSIRGMSPHTELMINREGLYGGSAGEIVVKNAANSPDKTPTGIIPRAGDKIDVVVHAIWDDASNGLLQIWINGSKVYDKQVATIYADYPWGGNAKWGIYKWPWRQEAGVQESLNQNLPPMETYMGTLRMITRKPGDVDYGKNSYESVRPD